MARTIAEIKKEMTDAFLADERLCERYGNRWDAHAPTVWEETFSAVSIENLIIYVVACSFYLFERLMDAHWEDVNEVISHRAHTLTWYRDKALEYRYGQQLTDDYAEYSDEDLTDTEIERMRIVKKCSCTTAESNTPTILVKVAKEDRPLDTVELESFTAYMREIADAGISLTIRSLWPDEVGFSMKIWYDPLVVDESGKYLDGSSSEHIAKLAVDKHLSSLPYNGALYPRLLEQYIMQQRGVKMCKIVSGRAWYEVDGAPDTVEIGDTYIPYSGAMVYNDVTEAGQVEYINFQTTYEHV